MLASTARGFVGDSSRIRAVRDRASSNASIAWNVATAVTAFAVDAVKAARGVNTQGNFGVILERLGVEMDNGKMVSRFEKIAPSAAAAFRV